MCIYVQTYVVMHLYMHMYMTAYVLKLSIICTPKYIFACVNKYTNIYIILYMYEYAYK
jgi:hypothetical protein